MATDQQSIANLIYTRFREAGFSDVQAKAAVANAYAESRLDPTAHNQKGEDSVGLFQLNRKGGEGKGYSVEELKDPETFQFKYCDERPNERSNGNEHFETTNLKGVLKLMRSLAEENKYIESSLKAYERLGIFVQYLDKFCKNININPHSQEFISLDVAQNFYTCKSNSNSVRFPLSIHGWKIINEIR
jgi:hypothetical protein